MMEKPESDLVAAIRGNNTEDAIRLLGTGVNPDVMDSEGTWAICLAIENGNTAILRELLRHDADVSVDPSEFTFPGLCALHLCFDEPAGKETIMEILLEHNIELGNLGAVGGLAHQIWSWAVKHNYTTILSALLRKGIPVDLMSIEEEPIGEKRFRLYPYSHQTALYSAFETQTINVSLVELLLSRKADPDCKGRTPSPLLKVSMNNRFGYSTGLIQKLLHKGADPNVLDPTTGHSVLSLLCRDQGALWEAAASLAIDKGASRTIDSRSTSQQRTALHYACRSSYACTSLIAQLIDADADVNSQDADGHTPLWHVANFGNKHNANILLERGAIVDCHGDGSTTPLMEAARYNAPELVMRLVDAGADVNAICKEQKQCVLLGPIQRPDHVAKEIVLPYLLAKGASPVMPEDFPRQPLVEAINTEMGCRSKLSIVAIIHAIVKELGPEKLKSILQKSTKPLYIDGITTVAFKDVGIEIFDELPPESNGLIPQDQSTYELIVAIDTIDKPWVTKSTNRFLRWRTGSPPLRKLMPRLEEIAKGAGKSEESNLDDVSPTTPVPGRTYTYPAAGSRALSDADEYMKRLINRRDFLLDGKKINTYEPVRIAILDSGINAKHPISNYVRGYKDFVSEGDDRLDSTGHGTNGVLVTLGLVPNAHVYVARVFEKEPTHPNTPSLVAQAMKHAIYDWKVHIIAMSFGFADDYKAIEREVHNAQAESVLVFAAVGNDGNRARLPFPARMEGSVVRVSSTNGNVKASGEFNPAPSLSSVTNFGFLGEHVLVKTARGADARLEGTSVATSVAAATAALLIDFSQREDCVGLSKRGKLRTVRGMSAVLAKLATKDGKFYCFNPWSDWLAPSDQVAASDTLKRKYICGTIDRELGNC